MSNLDHIFERVLRETGYNKRSKRSSRRPPKNWDSLFTAEVIDAYNNGSLTEFNIPAWDKALNAGMTPNPPFNTSEILEYYIKTGVDPRSALKKTQLYVRV